MSGADAKLYNNATQVVLLRDGVRTVLSMANAYKGPPEGFAMVVPVPVVLHEENVKTLPAGVFDRLDRLSAPRLVQYWEQDPCDHPRRHGLGFDKAELSGAMPQGARATAASAAPLVRVEAEFSVGEYEIVILSAQDSTALDTWLRQNGYRIPEGAEPVLRPYVAHGSKFFVAKVELVRQGPASARGRPPSRRCASTTTPTRSRSPFGSASSTRAACRISSSTSSPAGSATRPPTTRTSPSPPTSS